MIERSTGLVSTVTTDKFASRRPGRRTASPFRLLIIQSLIVLLLSLSPAYSQVANVADEAESIEADEEAFQGVEEMMVEARRRSEDIQKIGESVSSFSANDILDQGLTNFNDLQYNVPNLFSGGGLTKITLRGVGSEVVGPGVDPGFAVHVNGVFSARETTGLINYFDIERVDVLRGPQGTLWGRNSTGGALNIVTKKAEYSFDANGDIEYNFFDGGNDGALIRAMMNMPLVDDTLALRVALLTTMNDGQLENQTETSSQRVNDAAATTLRASLRWDPHDDVRVDLIGGWVRSNGAGPSAKFEGEFFTPVSPDPTVPLTLGAGPGNDYTGALPNPNDPYKGTANEPNRSDSTVWTATMLVAWEAELFKLDSITGYQSTDFFVHQDFDYSSLPISVLELTDESRQISQEFVVNSTWDEPFQYTVGTIYQYDWTPQTLVRIDEPVATNDVVPYRLLALPAFVDGPLVEKDAGDPFEVFTNALTEAKNHVFGLYTNLSFEILEGLKLTAGARYSYTHRTWNDDTLAQTFVGVNSATIPPLGALVVQIGEHQRDSWDAGTWKVGVEWEATEDNLLWVSVGTGSRAGGFNFAEESSFKQEEILAVEAGIKNSFFDNRLTVNIAGFWYDWTDSQIGATEGGLPTTKNAPSAKSYGVELDFRAMLLRRNLILNGSFGWLEAEYNKDFSDFDGTIQDFSLLLPPRSPDVNINGNRMPRSPRFTASFGAMYVIDRGRMGTFTPRVDFYYRDKVQFRQYGNPDDVADRYTRTDARIVWRSESEQFWGEIFGRNLENEAVKTNQSIIASIYRAHNYDAPRSFGFRVGYNY
ncbi:MAG: TonB-dependent receptor [Myxococcales bacterium]